MEQQAIKAIPEYPHYLAGIDGTIWTCRRKGGNDRGPGRLGTPRPMRQSPDARGYSQVSLMVEGKVVTRKVHTLILLAFIGPPEKGQEACHYPDQAPSNNRLENLRWDSHQENIRDRFRDRGGPTKICTGCGADLPSGEFYSDKRNSDGKKSQCKPCHNLTAVATRDIDKKRLNNRNFMRRYRALK